MDLHKFSAIRGLYQKNSDDNRKLFYFDALRVAMPVMNTASGHKKYKKRKIKTTD